ncbi:Do family serine endopeptidase [Novosphingobium sp. 1949]|uniref:Probable periplasmic serine endoprotease DegP-like n=1 Tax=Novosphingobium organovorum TaxID=2930092 RepID=A0ABT0BAD1_9SPHN|nr:Do family serine endopeptidase [Novosphingobium organovorum]MCJ2181754.1 Do family serine endopeptidase [Novosphingobium organovorum]
MEESKDVKPVRYAYGLTTALLVGGATLSLVTGYPAGAQVAQNEASQMATVVPKAGAPASFADLTAQLAPAVVNISTRQRLQVQQNNPFAGTPFEGMFGGGRGATPQTREAQSLGSGFVISADGYIVTNNHVITADGKGEVESITVTTTDGTEYPAKLIGKDAASDLAVLKIEGKKPFPFVKFGDSTKARVGDWIIAIGNPFGLSGTVTQGIISAVYRNTGGGAYDRYLQTDAAINKGNSGGPMFDMHGNVIGINNAIFSPTGGSVGIGFAIPAETAAPIVQKLIKGEAIERGYLGVRIQPLNDDLADALGVEKNKGEFIQSVEPDGAAAKAGIKGGDVILSVGGKEVTRDQTLSFLVANTAPGSRIPIELLRDGRKMTVSATVDKRPSEAELDKAFDPDDDSDSSPFDKNDEQQQGVVEKSLGLSVIDLTPQIARQLGITDPSKGVVISGVDDSSDAAAKGLKRGMLLLMADGKEVNTKADLAKAVSAAKASGRAVMLLRVQPRGTSPLFIPVRLN